MSNKNVQYNAYLWPNRQCLQGNWGRGVEEYTTVTSDFRPKVEIQPFCACAMKNMQYNIYLWLNCLNFRILKEIGSQQMANVPITVVA